VYRLTLVAGWNTEELEDYATLVMRARPHFIEIKGATFCGTSKASKMTMENVPWHEGV
jgi:tRNA wybutosine-synthesizing protein 1